MLPLRLSLVLQLKLEVAKFVPLQWQLLGELDSDKYRKPPTF